MSLAALLAVVSAPPLYVDLTAVFLGGVSGALFATQRKAPISGVLAIAVVAGFGGSMIRDVLLNVTPVVLANGAYVALVVLAALTGFYFASLVKRVSLVITLLDAVWMALYAVVGAEKSLGFGLNPWAAILIGVVTGVGGGILRDILAGEVPEIMLPGPINQFAVIVGSALYVGMVAGLHANRVAAEVGVIALVFGLRVVGLHFGVTAPEPVDLPAKLPRTMRRTLRARGVRRGVGRRGVRRRRGR